MKKTFKKILGLVTVIVMLSTLSATPPALAAGDAATITFDMISEQAPNAVTEKLNLVSELGSYKVTWSSNNAAVIATDGTVTRASTDTKVALTAMVGQTAKSFQVTVPGTNVTVGSSEGFTKASDLSEFVIEHSASASYGTYSEETGKITGPSAEVSIEGNSAMLISQTGTGQSRVNRPIASGAAGLSGIVVVEKRIRATAGFNWFIKSADNSNIVRLMRTGKQIIANDDKTGNYTYEDYDALSSTEYITYTVVLDTASQTYSVYINGTSPGEKMTNIRFNANRNNVAKGNDWLEAYPRVNGSKVYVDYSSVCCYKDAASIVNGVMQTLNINDILGENLSAKTVVSKLNLPALFNGVEISWSSNSAAVSSDGAVTRPDTDTEVTLTATLKKGTATVTKDYKFTVLKKSDTVIDATDFYSLAGYRGFEGQDGETAKIGTGFNRKIAAFTDPGKGYFSVEGRFKMVKGSTDSDSAELQIRMPGYPSVSGQEYPVALFVNLTADNKLTLTAKDGIRQITPVENVGGIIEYGKWFDLRIELDTKLGKYYVYIDDKAVNESCMSIDIIDGTQHFTSVIFSAKKGTDAYIDGYTYKKVSELSYDEKFTKTVVFKEGDSQIDFINDIKGEKISVSMDIFNPDGLSKNIYMIAASYLNGALYDCVLKNVDIKSESVNISISTDRELSVPENKEAVTIKCFTVERGTLAPFDGEEIRLRSSAAAE